MANDATPPVQGPAVLGPMKDTTGRGDLTELEVAMALMRTGMRVLKPLSSGLRYDLVIDEGGGVFTRVQCKTGILKGGAVQFRLYSINVSRHFLPRTYHGEVDAFGVYCPQLQRCYLVPMSVLERNCAFASLRVAPTRNGQAVMREAKDFEVG